jgi:hypothetical protein
VHATRKFNCWEIKKCGREPGGTHAGDLGVCPATREQKLHGVHGGKNAGRSCWVLAGTLCGGTVQGTFAQKYGNCQSCDFYEAVKKQEFPAFKLSMELLKMLGKA